MSITRKTLAAVAACAMTAAPMAVAGGAAAHPGKAHTNHQSTSSSGHGKAYGKFCQAQSKKHVAGQKGTPFSQCVTAMAKLANGTTTKPATACAALSHKHVAGMKRTPYSECVVDGNKLLHAAKHT